MTDNKSGSYSYWRDTGRLEPEDGRLKILWIEDRATDILPLNTADLKRWFSIISVTGPLSLKRLFEESQDAKKAGHGLYCAPGLPCDILLTDFRLCHGKEDCSLKSHLDIGLHAPSGGFLLGILTSLWWPDHPQSIIPYSAYKEEFGQIWKICQNFCPPTVTVLWDESVSKGTRNPRQILVTMGPEYRRALLLGFEQGIIHMPIAHYDSWHQSLEDNHESIDGQKKVWLVGPYGLRPVLVGSLFFDKIDNRTRRIPTDVFREWLDKVPASADPIVRRARLLAETYFWMRITPMSRFLYRMFRSGNKIVEAKEMKLPEKPPSFPNLFAWKNKIDGDRLVRLAFLFLVIREHTERQKHLSPEAQRILSAVTKISSEVSPEELIGLLRDAITDFAGKDRARLEHALKEFEESATLGGLPLFDWDSIDDDTSVLDEAEQVLSDQSIVQLIDPIPSSWNPQLTLDKSQNPGRALCRLWSRTEKELYDVHELLKGDQSHISPAELACSRRYAAELSPSEDSWPAFIKHTSLPTYS